ncbi:MAG: hypothetical protein ACR2KQ_00365 [Actinomycetota bacterium]
MAAENDGIHFRERSSQAVGRSVFADAVAGVDPGLAARIHNSKEWRKTYLGPVREVVEAGARSGAAALRIADEGLRAVAQQMVFRRAGQEMSLAEAYKDLAPGHLHTTTIPGRGPRGTEPVIPFKGNELRGGSLDHQLDDWVSRGTIEASCAAAVRTVMAHPEWMDLSGQHFVLLGAASEMGPLEWLTRWGAEVLAIDLPRPELWRRIITVAEEGSGNVHIPSFSIPGGSDLAEIAGADLLEHGPEVRAWIASFEAPLVIGNYVYADGSTFLRLAAGMDGLIASLTEGRNDVAISYLATPTDVFAVPREVALAARAHMSAPSKLMRALTLGKTFSPNYQQLVRDDGGSEWGIADALVPQQGPNYALAKMLQRWRATASKASGRLTSANVAPATKTRSVMKNKVLAAAFRGASAFGVEVFDPSTARALNSLLLLRDLKDPQAPGSPASELAHPFDLFVEGAAHGGMWRLGYEPRSVLPLAVGVGLLRRP